MNLTLHVWRQKGPNDKGLLAEYQLKDVSPEASFLEMLDQLNEDLMNKGEEPVAFDHDCREGICGMCSLVINGRPHGPGNTTTCQLHMRTFKDQDHIYIEPWRARAFPIIKDLVTDRSAFDRVIQTGGYISANLGSAPEANGLPVPKSDADAAFNAATCIGCGACVAACPNASAMLFVAAKVEHLARLPQGQAEREHRVINMVKSMDAQGFGNCSNHAECEAVCPKGIKIQSISFMNREYYRAKATTPAPPAQTAQ